MTNILSDISGKLSKSLILGTLVPTSVFVVLLLLLGSPLVHSDSPLVEALRAANTTWQVLSVSFMTLLSSLLLYNFNIPIIRFYEGYPWKYGAIGEWRTRRYKAQRRAVAARSVGMRTFLRALGRQEARRAKDDHTYGWVSNSRAELYAEWRRVSQRASYEFPQDDQLVLPTRLGNVIRSFEEYPDRQYGMAAITLWPRLIAKIDKDYASGIDDTKTSFDFMINSSFLSGVLTMALLLAGILGDPTQLASISLGDRRLPWQWIAEVATAAAMTYLFYLGAVGRAGAWGATVKAAFDLYRWDLLQQLGFKHRPSTKQAERDLWDRISRQMIYGDPPRGAEPDYAAYPAVQSDPDDLQAEIARGVEPAAPGGDSKGELTIVIRVRNVDERERPAASVFVTDLVSEGLDYLWGSARVDGTCQPRVVGSNPYRFAIGAVAPREERTLTYRVIACVS